MSDVEDYYEAPQFVEEKAPPIRRKWYQVLRFIPLVISLLYGASFVGLGAFMMTATAYEAIRHPPMSSRVIVKFAVPAMFAMLMAACGLVFLASVPEWYRGRWRPALMRIVIGLVLLLVASYLMVLTLSR